MSRLYCNAKHSEAHREQKKQAEALRQKIAMRDGTWFSENRRLLEAAQQRILYAAPRTACGYLTSLYQGEKQPSLVLPIPGRVWRNRVDGSRSQLPYFELRPFEAPRVPRTAHYQIIYVGDSGLPLTQQDEVLVELPGCRIVLPKPRIFGTEIERVLARHPAVHQSAAIGISENGKRVAQVFIVAKPGVDTTEGELLAFLKEKLPEYKVPASLRFIEVMPVDATGRILKESLRLMESGQASRQS